MVGLTYTKSDNVRIPFERSIALAIVPECGIAVG